MSKLLTCICCGVLGLVSLFQVLCFAAGTNGPNSNFELVGSQWRLMKEDPRFGHEEYLLVFIEAGKMIFANTLFNDEWEVSGNNVELRLNRGDKVIKYTGRFIDRNHMSGNYLSPNGIKTEWNAYRHQRKCFATNSSKSNLNLEICLEAETVGEKRAVEPYLTPWKTEGRRIYYSKGFSSQTVNGTFWLLEQKGQILKFILSVKNSDTITQRMPVPLLSDVVINSKDGVKRAGALCYPRNQLIVKMNGKPMETDIYPNETVELLYYVPMFHGKAVIEVKGLGTSKIVRK